MKIIFLQILTSTILVSAAVGQITRSPLSSPYTSVTTYSKKFSDVFSFAGNQAALVNIHDAAAGIYRESKFGLTELSNYHAAIAIPLQNAGIGVNMFYTGHNGFNEMQAGIAYGLKLSKSVSLGAQMNYNQIRITGYGSAGTVNIEMGALWAISEKVIAGVHIYNPIGGKFGVNKSEKFASIYKGGIAYEASKQFLVSAEIAKEEDRPLNVNASMQYCLLKQLLLRGGVSTATANYFGGAGLVLKWFRIDVIASYHRQLGLSPAVMLIFNLSQKTAEQ